jgi:hypothetical protein
MFDSFVLRATFWSMTKKRTKKAKVRSGLPPTAEPATAVSPAVITFPPVSTTDELGRQIVMPAPEQLLMEAEGEANYRNLASYSAVIGTLRGKGFSYREIAEWLSERGVPVDHNAVYRIYTNSLPADIAQRETENAAQEEHDRDRLDGVL